MAQQALKHCRTASTFVIGAIVIVASAANAQSRAGYSCKVGDSVEGYNVGWYKAAVTEVGTGDHAGYCYLKWEKFSGGQWISLKNIRQTQAAPKPPVAAASSAPLPTQYSCGVFLNNIFTPTQSLTLRSNKTYETNRGSSGTYRFDSATKSVIFEGGALSAVFGSYEPDNHQILRLTAKSDGDRSAQAQKWRSQVCSPQR